MSVSGRGLEWTSDLEDRLCQLAEEGLTGYAIASELSAELGVPISADAVYVKASRLGISLMGRSSSYEVTREDPFSCPSWLRRDLKDIGEPDRQSRPTRALFISLDGEASKQQVQCAYEGLWHDYVSEVVRNGLATDKQAERALKSVPGWFRKWSRVVTIECWDPDDERIQKYEKSLTEGASVSDVKRALEIEDLLEENADLLGESACGDETPNPAPQQTDITSIGDPAAGFTISPALSGCSSHPSRVPPTKKCARCEGSPKWDTTLEEWVCGTCGGILRFQKT